LDPPQEHFRVAGDSVAIEVCVAVSDTRLPSPRSPPVDSGEPLVERASAHGGVVEVMAAKSPDELDLTERCATGTRRA